MSESEDFLFRLLGKAVVVVVWIILCTVQQLFKAIDIPGFNIGNLSIHIDGEVKEVCHIEPIILRILKDVDSFYDNEIRSLDGLLLVRDDIINLVRIDGDLIALTIFELVEEIQKELHIITFREALAIENVLFNQGGVGIQETIGGHQFNSGTRKGPRKKDLKETTSR